MAMCRSGKGIVPNVPDSLITDAKDFIFECLQVDPQDWPTTARLLKHPFVRRQSQM